MKWFVPLALLVVAASALKEEEYQEAFTNWMVKYEKSYAPAEFFYRFDVFKANMDFVQAHNAANYTWTVGLNLFADLTLAEYKLIYLGYKPDLRRAPRKETFEPTAPSTYPSGSLDWVALGKVTGVKNQGNCGSCWAFSTTGCIEGLVAIKYNSLVSLSEEQLVDCAGAYGNQGCNGGLMDDAFKYCMTYGEDTEASYPYTAGTTGTGGTCKYSASISANTKIGGYTNVATNENALGAATDQQPISIAVQANQAGFQMYTGGVFCGICGQNLDHGILTVGYGNSPSAYWKVKNSWGTSWGEQGYMRMCRNQDECGIANEPSYAHY
jgi:hypothetical protein